MQVRGRQLHRNPIVQRLRYEAIYSWPGWSDCSTFNVGFAPADSSILSDPDFAGEPNQIQLYAELLATAGVGENDLRSAAVLEIAAGRGGGLRFIKKRFAPAVLIGIEPTWAGVRYARQRGLHMRRGYGERLPFEDGCFDLVLMLDALVHLAGREQVVQEARRVLKNNGLFLTGDFIKAPTKPAFDLVRSIATQGGFDTLQQRDATKGVMRSVISDEPRKFGLLKRVPFFLRRQLVETLATRESARYREWLEGARTYCLSVFVPTITSVGPDVA